MIRSGRQRFIKNLKNRSNRTNKYNNNQLCHFHRSFEATCQLYYSNLIILRPILGWIDVGDDVEMMLVTDGDPLMVTLVVDHICF